MQKGNFGQCRNCGKRILFVRMKSGKVMPVNETFVNYKKIDGGKEKIITPQGEVVIGAIGFKTDEADGYGYVSHFATCTKK